MHFALFIRVALQWRCPEAEKEKNDKAGNLSSGGPYVQADQYHQYLLWNNY